MLTVYEFRRGFCTLVLFISQVLHNASQELVYETCARDLVVQLMKGFNGTLFAYGQTGAGMYVCRY